MIFSSKAGYYMWPGPYGEWGSKKYLVASLDQSLKRISALGEEQVTNEVINQVKKLNELAAERGQSLSQMSLAWVLREGRVTSALIGASKVSQIEENVAALENFTSEELARIEEILNNLNKREILHSAKPWMRLFFCFK
jgi:L-glyceraldehyde 3-phosphate reductase